MPRIVLAPALTRWLDSAAAGAEEITLNAPGDTLAAALAAVFTRYPKLRGYVLDEHGGVRHHVAIFIDGTAIADKHSLGIPVAQSTEIYILQALSGG